ncbi:efflux RND transporter periplasmic adaptor subunit [Thiomicrorhabdus xiamenensis]|uniref:Efflux RND transporter periplasmic adaptor subunit n=1 Tax=Thiomicrorhabdus xiamenensis TaxID=2739063 RepID=A0A7D4P412_9GAMM|nr:efflux RND transporter periplasmic adaptor subunit [Thiomicrorhabdus xiamenensis]QKI88595.1 efflux RND transporter periplasmic adaptor subunit [Thiomicrorhabdus xiamenensis]
MKQVKQVLAIAILATIGLNGCQQEAPTAPETKPQTFQAVIHNVELGTVPLTAVVPGSVVPDQKARIASRLMGYIKGLDVEVGEKVEQGSLLFTIDSTDIRSQIAQANSAYAQAQAALKDAKLDYDRFTQLYKDNSVSKQQYDKIRLQYSVAQENLASAKSALNQARSQLNYANVRAPFSGVVVEKMATAGDLAAPGNPIVVIENLQSLSVQTEVAGDLYAALRVGDEATVFIDGQDAPMVGTIYTLVGAANPKTRTHTVKLSLPAVKNINSGTFARISFKQGERQAMMVPQSAIVNRAGIDGVFVVQDGKAMFNMVRTGINIGDMVEIQSGLDLGDQIVLSNNASMLNGDIVEPVAAQSASEAAK